MHAGGEPVQRDAHAGVEVGAVVVVEQGHRGVLLGVRGGGAGAATGVVRAHSWITRRNDCRPRWIALRTVACRQPRTTAIRSSGMSS
jgi:hypothetical protein